jgi:hypothetical protein
MGWEGGLKLGDGRTAQEELEILRTGLVRLANRMGLSEHVPGAPGRHAPFEAICEVAKVDRGWNALVARMMDRVEQMQLEAGEADRVIYNAAEDPNFEAYCEPAFPVRIDRSVW